MRSVSLIILVVVIFAISLSVSAAEVAEEDYYLDGDVGLFALCSFDDMTVIHDGRKTDGTLYQICRCPHERLWLFIDGDKAAGNGLSFINGFYYFVSGDGALFYGNTYGISATNGLLPAGSYTFDMDGRVVDPPYLPDNWEADWNYIPPTEPTEPLPSQPIGPEGDIPIVLAPSGNGIISFCWSILAYSLDNVVAWFDTIFVVTGMTPVYIAVMFFLFAFKYLLAPVIGGAGSDKVKKRRSENE